MLDPEHVIKHDSTSHIETNISPTKTEIAPTFTVDYSPSQYQSHKNEVADGFRTKLTDITGRQVLIGILQLTKLAPTHSSRIIELTTRNLQIRLKVRATRHPSRRVKHTKLSIRAMNLTAM
jgi:hypothetical protein